MNLKQLFFGGTGAAPISRRKKGLIAAGTALMLLIAFACGNAYGKYVQGLQKTGTISGKTFYFESDFLDVAAVNKTYTVYPGSGGTASVTFQLLNFIDDLRISGVDITFEVNVYDVTGGGEAEVPATINTYTNFLGKDAKNIQPVTLSGLEAGKTYLVTATGNGGYVKTIQAKFVVAPIDKKVYKHLKIQGEEVLLTVWTENVQGAAQITITDDEARNKLIPDNTDPALSGAAKGQAVITDQANSFANTYSSHLYRFFNPEHIGDLGVGDFDVSVNGTTADPGTP